jgi:hypothetical protein
MAHDGLYDTLLLLGLLWLSMLLYWVWLRGRPVTSPTTLTSVIAGKRRSQEPTPFAGLLHKPLCDACEQAATSRLPSVRRHPRSLSPGDADARSRHGTSSVLMMIAPTTDG